MPPKPRYRVKRSVTHADGTVPADQCICCTEGGTASDCPVHDNTAASSAVRQPQQQQQNEGLSRQQRSSAPSPTPAAAGPAHIKATVSTSAPAVKKHHSAGGCAQQNAGSPRPVSERIAFGLMILLAASLTLLEQRTAATNPSLARWAVLAELVLWQLGVLTYRGAVSMTAMLLSHTLRRLWQHAVSALGSKQQHQHSSCAEGVAAQAQLGGAISFRFLLGQAKLIKLVLLGPSNQKLWCFWLAFSVFRIIGLTDAGGRPAELRFPWNWGRLVSQIIYTVAWFDLHMWLELVAGGIVFVLKCVLWVWRTVGPALSKIWRLVGTFCSWVKLVVVTACQWVELGLAMYGVGLATAFTWLRQTAPAARQHLLRAWGLFTRVLWVLVAAALLSFPWQFTKLEQLDKGLAFLLPFVQHLMLHLLSAACNRGMLLGKGLSLQVTNRLFWVHNLVWAAVTLNWFVLSTEAIASGSILESAEMACSRGVYVPNMRAHLAAHFGLSVVYLVLLVAVHAVVVSQAARSKLQIAAALLLWLPKTAAHLVHCAVVTWPLAVLRAVGRQLFAVCGLLLSGSRWLAVCFNAGVSRLGECMRLACLCICWLLHSMPLHRHHSIAYKRSGSTQYQRPRLQQTQVFAGHEQQQLQQGCCYSQPPTRTSTAVWLTAAAA